MKKISFLTLLCLLAASTRAQASIEIQIGKKIEIGVPIDGNVAIEFPEAIVHKTIGTEQYNISVQETRLLINAKSEKSMPTTLHVTYGQGKKFFAAMIFLDKNAPLDLKVAEEKTESPKSIEGPKEAEGLAFTSSISKQAADIFPQGEEQTYFDLGQKKDGVKVILTNITHYGEATYFKICIENNTTTKLNLTTLSFEYISLQRRFLVFQTKKNEPVPVLFASDNLEIAPKSSRVFVFAISTLITSGGLEILMQEDRKKGHRDFRFLVPLQILLYANRK